MPCRTLKPNADSGERQVNIRQGDAKVETLSCWRLNADVEATAGGLAGSEVSVDQRDAFLPGLHTRTCSHFRAQM